MQIEQRSHGVDNVAIDLFAGDSAERPSLGVPLEREGVTYPQLCERFGVSPFNKGLAETARRVLEVSNIARFRALLAMKRPMILAFENALWSTC